MVTASSKSTQAAEGNQDRAAAVRRRPRLFPGELFLFGGATREEILDALRTLGEHLEGPDPAPLQDLSFTVSRSYDPEHECLAIVASSSDDLLTKMRSAAERLTDPDCERIQQRDGVYWTSDRLGRDKVAFLFPGENAQYVNMLAELCLHFPEMRQAFDETDTAVAMADDGFLPSALNFPAPFQAPPDEDEIAQWEKAVVLVHTANIALSRLLQRLEMTPDAVLGHSFGELSALEMAGVLRPGTGPERLSFSHHAYLHLRELSHERDLPVGLLLAVGGAERDQIDALLERFPGSLEVAMQNCPHQYVLCTSGPEAEETLQQVSDHLVQEGAICSLLPIRRPYHTPFFEPAFPFEKAYYEEVGVHPPEIEAWSCSTADTFPSEPKQIVEVCARHWMSCVRFQDTIEAMHDRGFRVFIDVGPRGNLCAFVNDILRDRDHLTVAVNRAGSPETLQLLNALGLLAAHGVPLSLDYLHEPWGSRLVDLSDDGSKRRKPMPIQLPIHIPPLQTGGFQLPAAPKGGVPAASEEIASEAPGSLPVTSAPPAAPVPAAAPAVPDAAATAGGGLAATDPASAAMVAYMETMDRFLATQQEIMVSLFGSSGLSTEATSSLASDVPIPSPASGVPDATPGGERFLLLGEIEERVEGETLTARRVFDIEQDLYLKHHALGTALSRQDADICALPIMPLLFSLELAAQAAAALFPHLVVTCIANTRGHRWIFYDRGTVELRTVAKRLDRPGPELHVAVSISEVQTAVSKGPPLLVETEIVLAESRPDPQPSTVEPLPKSDACVWTGSEIYPRRTFHGPLFQGIRDVVRHSNAGLDGTIEVLANDGVLRDRPDVFLESDPIISDSLGQAAWLWGSKEAFNGLAYLPYGLDELRYYGPRLTPGTRLELRLRIRSAEDGNFTIDIEGVDENGDIRVVLDHLHDREFPITAALHRFMMEPLEQTFSHVELIDVPLASSTNPVRVTLATIADFPTKLFEGSFGVWRKALAFLALGREERTAWMGMDVSLQREIEWLLGRTAAKDALRRHLGRAHGLDVAAVDLAIHTTDEGRPVVQGRHGETLPAEPQVSIAHTRDLVVAAATDGRGGLRIGVDVEPVRALSDDLVEGSFSDAELALLPSGSPDEIEEWRIRAWCAKEAVGKALGTGLELQPLAFVVKAADPSSGVLKISPRGQSEVVAATMRRDGHVLAVALLENQCDS